MAKKAPPPPAKRAQPTLGQVTGGRPRQIAPARPPAVAARAQPKPAPRAAAPQAPPPRPPPRPVALQPWQQQGLRKAQASGDPSSFLQAHPGVLQHQMKTEQRQAARPQPPPPMAGGNMGPQPPPPQMPGPMPYGNFDRGFGGQPMPRPPQQMQGNPQMGSDAMQQGPPGPNLFGGGQFDPRAMTANPGGFQNWMQGAQLREQQMPGSTMLGWGRSPQMGGDWQWRQPMPNMGTSKSGFGGQLGQMGQGGGGNPWGVNPGMQSVLNSRGYTPLGGMQGGMAGGSPAPPPGYNPRAGMGAAYGAPRPPQQTGGLSV